MRRMILAMTAVIGWHSARAADDPVPLKIGGELTGAMCSACHTSNYIVMNSVFLSPAAWKAEVTKMRTVFGAPIDDDTATAIVAYLAANYAVKP